MLYFQNILYFSIYTLQDLLYLTPIVLINININTLEDLLYLTPNVLIKRMEASSLSYWLEITKMITA